MDGLRRIRGWWWSKSSCSRALRPFPSGYWCYRWSPTARNRYHGLNDEEKRFVDLRLWASGVRSATENGGKFLWKLLLRSMHGLLEDSLEHAVGVGELRSERCLWVHPPANPHGTRVCHGKSSAFNYPASRHTLPVVCWHGWSGVMLIASNITGNVGPMYFAILLAQISIYLLLPGTTALVGNNIAQSPRSSTNDI